MPPVAARASWRREMLSRPSSPIAAQTISRAAAPKTQRHSTTSTTGRPEITTNQLMVPEMTIAAVISAAPRVLTVMAALLGRSKAQVYLACRGICMADVRNMTYYSSLYEAKMRNILAPLLLDDV